MIATGPMADRVTASGEHFAMRRSFAEAWARRPDESTRKRLVLVGRPASLSMVGLDLWRALGPTFAHLVDGELDPNEPGPALEFWDRAVVRLPRPEAPRDFDWFLERSDWRLTAHGQFRYLREERPNSVFWIDRELVAATCMYEAADKIVLLERARPLQRMMTMLSRRLGVLDVHAGIVSRGGRGVLIVGGRGRGKSTTSIDGLYGGLDYLGDDSVGVARSKDGFTGFSLYASARIDPTKLARWPAMRNAWLPAGPEDEKALLLPAVSHPGRVGRDTRLVAIALPSVTGGLVRASPVAPRDAFMALVWQSRDVRRFPLEARDFRLLVALTRTIPCYRLEVGPDPVAVAEGLDRLIDGRSS